jgi:hypothetical protein
MIINPSANTVIPRRNAFRNRSRIRRQQAFIFPCGKPFFFAVSKVACGAAVFLFLSSLWLGSSIRQVDAQITTVEMQRDQLVNSNILMRAKKANMFSPETVGIMAGDQFAIHLPGTEQYKFIK